MSGSFYELRLTAIPVCSKPFYSLAWLLLLPVSLECVKLVFSGVRMRQKPITFMTSITLHVNMHLFEWPLCRECALQYPPFHLGSVLQGQALDHTTLPHYHCHWTILPYSAILSLWHGTTLLGMSVTSLPTRIDCALNMATVLWYCIASRNIAFQWVGPQQRSCSIQKKCNSIYLILQDGKYGFSPGKLLAVEVLAVWKIRLPFCDCNTDSETTRKCFVCKSFNSLLCANSCLIVLVWSFIGSRLRRSQLRDLCG